MKLIFSRTTFCLFVIVSLLSMTNANAQRVVFKGGDNDGYSRTTTNFGMSINESLLTVCEGDKVVVSAVVKGEGIYLYQWARLNDVGGTISDSSSCVFERVTTGIAGKYYCRVTDRRGAVSLTDTVEIKVFTMPTVSIEGRTRMAKGDSIELKVNGTADEFLWSGGSKERTLWVKPVTTTTYMVTGTNGGLCRKSASIDIEVTDLFVRSQGNVYAVQNEKVTLKVESNADTVKWYEKQESASKARAVTNEYGTYIGSGKEIEVTAQKTTEYTAVATFEGLSKATILTVLVRDNRFYKGGDNDGYTRTASDFSVTTSASPAIACEDVPVSLTAVVKGESQYEFEWTKVGSTTVLEDSNYFEIAKATLGDDGKYVCKVTDARLKVSKFDTVELTVNARAIADIVMPTGRNILICYQADTLQLYGSFSNSTNATLKWHAVGGGAAIFGDPTDVTVRVSPSTDTKFVLTADNEGCSTTDTLEVRVSRPEVFLDDQLRITEGADATLLAKDASGNALDGNDLKWYKDYKTNLGNGNPMVIRGISKSMVVSVDYKSGNCSVSDSIHINVKGAQAFRGGYNDGYTRTCQPPLILQQKGMNRDQCIAEENSSLQIIAEGTRIKYEWQKWDSYSGEFMTFVPSAGSQVEGERGPILTFKKLVEVDNGRYRCVLTNNCSNGEVVSDTFDVAVKGEPVITSGIHDRYECMNAGVLNFNIVAKATTTGTELTYQWYKDGVAIPDATIQFYNVFVSPDNYRTVQGLYKVIVSTKCGSVADSARLVTDNIPVVKDQSDSIYVCEGSKGTLWVKTDISGDYTYSLYQLSAYDELATKTLIYKGFKNQYDEIRDAGFYRWNVTNKCDANGAWSQIMYVKKEKVPTFVVQPRDTSLCEGQTLTLKSVGQSSGQKLKYIWYKNGVLFKDVAETGTLTIYNVAVRDAGLYQCEIFNSCTPVKSVQVRVTVKQPPLIISSPDLYPDYCIDSDSVLLKTSLAAGRQVDSMRWFYKGNPLFDEPDHIIGATTSELKIRKPKATDAGGFYFLRAYGACSKYAESKPVSFELQYPARFIRNFDGNVKLTMCAGEDQTLMVEVDPKSTAPVRYKWLHNQNEVANGTSNSLTITDVDLDEKGKYTCQVQNKCGNDQTEAYIQVHRPDTFRFEGGGRYCEFGEGVPARLVGSDSSVVYQLYRENPKTPVGDPVDGTAVDPLFGPINYTKLKAGTYYVTGKDTNKCEFTMPGKVTVVEDKVPLNFDLSVSRYICAGQLDGDLKLNGSEKGIVYYLCRERDFGGWDTLTPGYTGNGLALYFLNVPVGSYRVIAKNASNCWSDLSGIEKMKEQPLPVYTGLKFVNKDSVYCRNAVSDVALTYDFVADHKYRLQKEGSDFGNVQIAAPLMWRQLEAGNYGIEVSNEWGCKATFGTKTVRAQNPPNVHQLIGKKYFCSTDRDSNTLELLTSDAGVRYSFRFKPTTHYKDTLSQGGAIRLKIPLIERDYYVVAIDTTRERCESAMRDTISLVKSSIKIHPVSPVVIGYNESTQLKVNMAGYVGKPTDLVYTWGNVPMLSGSNTVPSPLTQNIKTTQIFPITVQDLSGCIDKSDVVVNVTGGELAGEIRLDDCATTAPDTVTICHGDSLFFCSVASGGVPDKSFDYLWWDDANASLGKAFRLENYLKNTSGYLHWKVVNGNQSVRDSVWVTVNPSPRIDTIENRGIQCMQSSGTIEIVLKSSEVSALYRLERKAIGGDYATLGVASMGTGGRLTFSISDPLLLFAKYRIVGTMSNATGGGTCERLMHGEVDVREAAKPFDVTGEGGYCKGVVPKDTITLVGSETGVNYSLLKTPSTLKETKPGTSNALEFIGNFEAGRYRVLAVKGDCRDTMPGVAEIKEYALPTVDTLIGAGSYCSENCPVEIGITPALKDIRYTLLVDTLNGGVGTEVFYGEERLVFGNYCVLGTYKVKSENTVTGCVAMTTDSVTITDTPTPFLVDTDGFACSSSSAASVALSLRGAKENVAYNLYAVPGGNRIGGFTKLPGSLPFPTGDTLWFTGSLSLGNYVVEAKVGNCTLRSSDTIKIQSGRGIDQPQMSMPTEACEGAGAGITIDMASSMEGVRYTLYQKGNPEVIVSNLMGTGSGVSFPKITNMGTYYIMAVDTQSLCSRKLMPEYKIEKKPQPLNMIGDLTYCEDTDGVVIGLDGKESGMTYMLQRKDASGQWIDVSNILTANGAEYIFSGKHKQGIYRVLAGTICKVEMNNTLDIRPVKHPNKLIVKRQGMACVDSTMTLVVDGTALGETYTLFKDNVAVVGEDKPGNGATLTWTVAPLEKSMYTIKTTVSGCSVTLDSAVNVGKTPTLNQLEGDSIYCAGLEGKIFVNNNESGVRYDLYVMPANTLLKQGVASGGSIVFDKLKAGSYYVVASAGDCKVKNKEYKIREEAKPASPEWAMNDCVATDSGQITIKNRVAKNMYVLDGISIAKKVFKNTTGDVTLTKLPLGIYTLQLQDTLSGCTSDLLTDTIREGVYQDSLIRSFEYCAGTAGAKLEMSNVRSGVSYQILTPMGSVLETITRPVKLFNRDYEQDYYVFRKVRTGYLGGCYEDKAFTTKSRALPKKNIAVQLNGVTPVCAGGEYSVRLQNTEANMRYLLRLEGASVNIDTLYGNGTAQTFDTKIKAAGRYKIVVSDTVVFCNVTFDTTLTIHPLPRAVLVDSCSYCQVAGEPLVGCDIHLKGMQPSVKYTLNGADCILLGNGTGKFSKLAAGRYSVIMRDMVTGCVDTVKTSVKEHIAPRRYTLGGGCAPLAVVSSVETIDGSEGNDVTYELYKDGKPTGITQPGTGANIVFSGITLSGTYKVRAYKSLTGCATFMMDSVVLYKNLDIDGDVMSVVGSFCDGTNDGVRLEYPASTKGWRYYITNGVFNSDTLSGYDGKLSFTKINGMAIQNGTYELYALNPCNGKQLLATATVTAKAQPALFTLSPASPHSLCTDATFEIVLGGSESGVSYTVTRYNTQNVYVEKYAPVMGGTTPLSLGTFSHAGFYEVVGSNGCKRVWDKIGVKKGSMPTEYDIIGTDNCLTAGGAEKMQISLPRRETNIAYYLHLNGGAIPIDTLDGVPLTQLAFKEHSDVGCYTVVGKHAASGCSLPMRGTYCMSTPPNIQDVVSTGDTVDLCFGNEHCIEISNSQIGIQYELAVGNGSYGRPVAGTGARMQVGCVEDAGTYKVMAKVGTCQAMMNDSVIVRVNPIPELDLKPTYSFCEGKDGVQIEIGAPTDPNISYALQDPNGTVIETITGKADNSDTLFTVFADRSGVYKVTALNPVSGCFTLDSTLVTEEHLPTGYNLVSSNGQYICFGSSVTLTQTGSEPGVTYELVREPELVPLETRVGAVGGGAIAFSYKVKEPGRYKVRAVNGFGLNCETYFNSITLEVAPEIMPYPIEKIKSSYCSTGSDMGSIRLSGSNTGIEYELQKDGRLTGIIQGGTGGALTWNNLEGKACMGNDMDGYEYRIVARDPTTKCTRNMLGSDTIMAVDPLIVLSYMPNEAYSEKCGGDFIRFNMTVSGCRATYTWYRNGAVIKSGKDEYYNIDSVRPSDAGVYWCDVTNVCNTVEMPKSQLEVKPLVVLAESMPDVYICDNKPRDVILSAGFKNATDYTWYKAEKPDSVLGRKSYIEFPQFKKEQSGKYVCKAENGCNPPAYDTCVVSYSILPDITFSRVVEDTICSGGMYAFPQLTINNVTAIRWMLNGNPLPYTGSRYILTNVQASDAGTYTVIAENTCGETLPIEIGTLWVDSPLTLTAHSDTLMMGCTGESRELFVNVTPEERVHYRWEYLGAPIANTPKLTVGPFDAAIESQRTYRVWYWNKCSTAKFKDIVIHIPKPFDLGETGGAIVTCADCATDTVIRLETDPSMMAKYEWYLQYSKDTTQKKLVSTTSEVTISNCSDNTGYYYCKVSNRCDNRTTETWWVRIDSIPVIQGTLPDDSVCIGGWTKITLPATGGGLTYNWHILKKGSSTPIIKTFKADAFESVGELMLSEIDMTYDSCRIWCFVQNTCGDDTSDTMVLRVIPSSEISIVPMERVCEGSEGRFLVTLTAGEAPWSYTYRNDGKEFLRSAITALTDTIKTKASGLHEIISLEDNRGCRRTGNLGAAQLEVVEKSYVTLTMDKDSICRGEEVVLSIEVSAESIGPWKLEIRQESDGDIASNVTNSSTALLLNRRDTSFTFTPLITDSYYARIWRVMADGTECEGESNGADTIFIKELPEVTATNLTEAQRTLGACKDIDLGVLFNPQPIGGKYIRNGVVLGSAWSNVTHDTLEKIQYRIEARGCSKTVELGDLRFVDSPVGTITTDNKVLCPQMGTDVHLQASGAYPVKMQYVVTFIDTLNKTVYAPPMSPMSATYIFTAAGQEQTLGVSYRPDLNGMIYKITRIEDKYGCTMKEEELEGDTVLFSHLPKHLLESRYGDGTWRQGSANYAIRPQDSVEFRAILLKGDKPWNVVGYRAPYPDPDVQLPRGIVKDTAGFWIKGPGYYVLNVDNVYGCYSSRSSNDIFIQHADTGYIKLMAYLEGPWDSISGKMVSKILPLIDKGSLSAWPVVAPKEIIDWVTVEVWTTDFKLYHTQKCILLDDGTVVDTTGNSVLALPGTVGISKSFHIALRHRNHLPLMSAAIAQGAMIATSRAGAGMVDLTRTAMLYCSPSSTLDKHASKVDSRSEVGIRGWALCAGEMAVKQQDPLLPQPRNRFMTMVEANIVSLLLDPTSQALGTTVQTIDYDINFNGLIEWPTWSGDAGDKLLDWVRCFKNRNQSTEVPGD